MLGNNFNDSTNLIVNLRGAGVIMNPGNAVTFVNRVDVEPIVKKFPLQEAFVMNNLTHIWVSVFVNVSGGTFSACRARI